MSAIPQRDALATLPKKRLTELAAGFEVDVPARAGEEDIVDALARSRRASFERILETLSPNEMKAIYRASGIDDSGTAKASIADRVLGREELVETAVTNGRGANGAVARDRGEEAYEVQGGNGKLTLQRLESHLRDRNHSAAFWRMVHGSLPDFRALARALDRLGLGRRL